MTIKKPDKEMMHSLLERYKPRSNDHIMEIMNEIYARMPWTQPIALSNGKYFILKKFIEPQFNPEKEAFEFGFDAQYTDGSGHIEFNVRKSGWEFRIDDKDE